MTTPDQQEASLAPLIHLIGHAGAIIAQLHLCVDTEKRLAQLMSVGPLESLALVAIAQGTSPVPPELEQTMQVRLACCYLVALLGGARPFASAEEAMRKMEVELAAPPPEEASAPLPEDLERPPIFEVMPDLALGRRPVKHEDRQE